ncbi:VOC family protein [Hyphococcus flavus]|uniref:VOC family protein n=1 Tax=Hyphococcus flavus TaxID=1866326 RepID=A0AAE9ZC68_9PROT|nr:VOC family protein [Hyphococcus flavus]WDI32168.1 VOC family protein [Hyphococcus flavus]
MAEKKTTETPAAQRLEHVNMVVTNLDATTNFLLAAFPEWRIRGEGGGEWAGVPRRWAHVGDDGNYLTLNEFKIPEAAKGRHRDLKGAEPGLAHLGFEVTDIDAVMARLKDAGYAPDHLGEDHPHRRNIYYVNEEGLEFEFVEYSSTIPQEKNLYQ